MASVLWEGEATSGLDRCELSSRDGGFKLNGTVLLAHEGAPLEIRYTVMTDEQWRTRSVGVHVQGPDNEQRFALQADGEGAWLFGRDPLDAVKGAIDVDLGFTPATNTLPIRRLDVGVGDSADLVVCYLRFPQLDIVRGEQRYDRLDDTRWRYSSGSFEAELVVDDNGLVIDYGDGGRYWHAVARQSGSTAGGG